MLFQPEYHPAFSATKVNTVWHRHSAQPASSLRKVSAPPLSSKTQAKSPPYTPGTHPLPAQLSTISAHLSCYPASSTPTSTSTIPAATGKASRPPPAQQPPAASPRSSICHSTAFRKLSPQPRSKKNAQPPAATSGPIGPHGVGSSEME